MTNQSISNIFSFETENLDPGSPRKNEKACKFWSVVKSLKNDVFWINTHWENGILKTGTLDKADICNRHFQSAFKRESDTEIPSKGTSPVTPWVKSQLTQKGSSNCCIS